MAENTPKKNMGRPMPNRSNAIRSIVFTILIICFAMFLITNQRGGQVQKTEVPISDVIIRKLKSQFLMLSREQMIQTETLLELQ